MRVSGESVEYDCDHGSLFHLALNQTAEGRFICIFSRMRVSVSHIALSTVLVSKQHPRKDTGICYRQPMSFET